MTDLTFHAYGFNVVCAQCGAYVNGLWAVSKEAADGGMGICSACKEKNASASSAPVAPVDEPPPKKGKGA